MERIVLLESNNAVRGFVYIEIILSAAEANIAGNITIVVRLYVRQGNIFWIITFDNFCFRYCFMHFNTYVKGACVLFDSFIYYSMFFYMTNEYMLLSYLGNWDFMKLFVMYEIKKLIRKFVKCI